MKSPSYLLLLLLITGLTIAATNCSTGAESDDDVIYNQTGKLIWGGSPATDGTGILFEVSDTTYGAPGDKDDYASYFSEDSNEIQIKANYRLTGKTTVRGWGATFPEIEFIKIEVAE